MPEILFDHLHLRCTDPEAAARWFERMLGGEVTVSLQSPRPGISLCFIRGPEGISIELLERIPPDA
jgi:catechol 2,3-dioxygenase-like lactoylglutathione lyase family enzyme